MFRIISGADKETGKVYGDSSVMVAAEAYVKGNKTYVTHINLGSVLVVLFNVKSAC